MSKSDLYEADFLDFTFLAEPITALDGVTELWVSLHETVPGESGDQTVGETTYGGYARVSVSRSGTGWTRLGNQVSPVDPIDFPQVTSGSGSLPYFAVGTSQTGSGYVLYHGTISPTIMIMVGQSPRLTTATTVVED